MPENVRKLIDEKTFAEIGTLMQDGSPQITTVWIDRDGDTILINTAVGRTKEKNLRRDPRVAISLRGNDNPYRMATIRGKVTEFVTTGADDHIDKLAMKYMGKEKYPWKTPTEQRVIIRITPEHVVSRL